MTGIDLMEQAASDSFDEFGTKLLDFKADYIGQSDSYFIDAIHDGTNFISTDCDNFPNDCFLWRPLKNGVQPPGVGISLIQLDDGDVLTWEYFQFDPNAAHSVGNGLFDIDDHGHDNNHRPVSYDVYKYNYNPFESKPVYSPQNYNHDNFVNYGMMFIAFLLIVNICIGVYANCNKNKNHQYKIASYQTDVEN